MARQRQRIEEGTALVQVRDEVYSNQHVGGRGGDRCLDSGKLLNKVPTVLALIGCKVSEKKQLGIMPRFSLSNCKGGVAICCYRED